MPIIRTRKAPPRHLNKPGVKPHPAHPKTGKLTRVPAPHKPTVSPTVRAGLPVRTVLKPVARAAGYDQDQLTNQAIVVGRGQYLGASANGIMSALCAGAGENSWHTEGCTPPYNACGFWQLITSWQQQHDYHDVAYWTDYAYLHGFYGYGGLIDITNKNPGIDPGRAANMCQGAYSSLDAGQQYYDRYLSEAQAVYQNFIGQKPPATAGQNRPAYINPLQHANVTPERIDQGVDYGVISGEYDAWAQSVVRVSEPGGWGQFGSYMEMEVTQAGPFDGLRYYYAEGIQNMAPVGAVLNAGDKACDLIPYWHSGTEIGWAAGTQNHSWAYVYGGGWTASQDAGDWASNSGVNFSALVQVLNGPGGIIKGPTFGTAPPQAVSALHDTASWLGTFTGSGVNGPGSPGYSATPLVQAYDVSPTISDMFYQLGHNAFYADHLADHTRGMVLGCKYCTATGQVR